MQNVLLERLVCPVCHGTLVLTVDEERDGEIITGSLRCDPCNDTYPITNSIPNMLPKDQRG